jgi:hypothetical protein
MDKDMLDLIDKHVARGMRFAASASIIEETLTEKDVRNHKAYLQLMQARTGKGKSAGKVPAFLKGAYLQVRSDVGQWNAEVSKPQVPLFILHMRCQSYNHDLIPRPSVVEDFSLLALVKVR